jgi:alpha-L-rhamnosidase
VHRFLLLVALLPLGAANPDLLTKPWSAQWIEVPGAPPFDYGVYHFRRAIELKEAPKTFVVHVSGDNRYQLFVNGVRVSLGPARGDLYHWRYETVDLAPHLKAGHNVLAAVVWNFSDEAPIAQITYRSGFLVQGDTAAERAADTGPLWRGMRDEAYQPVTPHVPGYYAAGPTERVDAARYPWGWEQPDYDDSRWPAAKDIDRAAPRDSSDSHSRWMLEARSIPPMEQNPQRLGRLRSAEGVEVPGGFPAEPHPFTIAANRKAVLLLDQNFLTTGYPELAVSGGKGATVRMGYAEALYRHGSMTEKGNRDNVAGKDFHGVTDTFLPDGGSNRLYRPLWWRTYRYVRLEVETAGEPLTVEDFRGVYTGYPFVRKARFDAGVPELQKILDVGWRTARLCAHETYMDCPYWEQLQYVGDTRVQALVSLYMTGDGRLVRNAIATLDASRTAEGATFSRAPSRLPQYIPGFSLWWIGMVHDYWMYQDDPEFVKEKLPGVRAVLAYFAAHQRDTGSLGRMPWWNYMDWVRAWQGGVPSRGNEGGSAPYDLQLLMAYRWAADLEDAMGLKAMAVEYRTRAGQIAAMVRATYWDEGRKMFADTAEKREFSQQANALAVLGGVIEGSEARDLMRRVAEDRSLTPCSIYFRYYLHAALDRAGLGDLYLDMLGPWREQLALGLTTWAETADPTRSDCHAWGASPNVELFRTVLGIDSAAPGFGRVVIRPNLGKLEHASGTMPLPKGELAVKLVKQGSGLDAEVTLPAGMEGEFEWNGQTRKLVSGEQRLKF